MSENQDKRLVISLEGTADTIDKIVNLLAGIEYNTSIGHATICGAFFDGHIMDRLVIKGIPKNKGSAMARACFDTGDDHMALFGEDTATAYRVVYKDGIASFSRSEAWPGKVK